MFGTVTYETYLKVFGHPLSESTDIEHDKFAEYGFSEDIHIHSGTEFILMVGVPLEDGNIDPNSSRSLNSAHALPDCAPTTLKCQSNPHPQQPR